MRTRLLPALPLLLALGLTLSLLPPPSSASAASSGRFFAETGYAATDEGGVRFWTEFNRLGGAENVGYPISDRFVWNGFVTQVFQKAALQWRPEAGAVSFVNVFDELHDGGYDDWLLAQKTTPKPLDAAAFDAGKDWGRVVKDRLALLEANHAIRARYYSVPDPLLFFGLPASPVIDMGSHYAVRLQRAVIQQWKTNVPWARAGQTTVANGGNLLAETGLLQGRFEQAAPVAAVVPVAQPALAADRTYSLNLLNEARARAGARSLVLEAKLSAAAQAQAEDMLARGYFAHAGPEGKAVRDWLREAGATYSIVGQNLGRATSGGGPSEPTIKSLFDMMMAETPPNDQHRANILRREFGRVGVGVAHRDGWLYWVTNFAD